ncbi:MAG: hypothetical protein HUK23_00065 [Sphaerochaetaceae bacterium]|nr:hypothetical protein [Sphaerochaetaceae bacterium]
MARIKSAWEIALEKTQDIQIDETKYLNDKLTKEGKTLAGSYLNDTDQNLEVLASKFNAYSTADKETVKKGIVETIFANISLPSDDLYKLRYSRTCDLVALASNNNAQAMDLMSQIGDFFQQYLDCKADFVNRMQEQIKQAMQTNPESVNSAQYSQLIQQNLNKMDAQYSGALENTKEQLKQLLY